MNFQPELRPCFFVASVLLAIANLSIAPEAQAEVFVISNRSGAIAPDCSGLGAETGNAVLYVKASRSATVCRAEDLTSNASGFLSALKATVATSKRPLVLFLHGSGQGFQTMVEKAEGLSARHAVNVLSLDWPVGETTGDYGVTHAKAEASGRTFAAVLKSLLPSLAGEAGAAPVHVFAHSMGNFVLQALAENSDPAAFQAMHRVIINAPDVMLEKHREWMEKVAGDPKREVYVVVNRKDRVIACATGALKGPLALACGIAVKNKIPGPRLGNTVPAADFAEGTTYLDVTRLKGMKNKHEYYLGVPVAMDPIYRELLNAGPAPEFKASPHTAEAGGRVLRFN